MPRPRSQTTSSSSTTISSKSETRVWTPAVETQDSSEGLSIAQTRLEHIASCIDHQLSSPPASLSLGLRFENVAPTEFAALLETSAYERLCATHSHARINYNSATEVLIVRCMSTPIHDTAQFFISNTISTNPILQPLVLIFNVSSGTSFTDFGGRFRRSRKQPDVLVRIKSFYWPTLVVETGWSEDHHDLVEDAKLWLLGGQGGSSVGRLDFQEPVNAAILIFFDHKNFEADSSSVTGDFEVWRRDPVDANAINMCLSKPFYPAPVGSAIVEFTLEEIVRAPNVPQGVPGTTPIQFDLRMLGNLVNDTIDILLHDLKANRRINAEKKQEEEAAATTLKHEQQKQKEAQTQARTKRADDRGKRKTVIDGLDTP